MDDTNNPHLQVNRYIDNGNKHNSNVTRYKATSPIRNRPQVRHGLRIMMHIRRSVRHNSKEAEVQRVVMLEWPDSPVERYIEEANQERIVNAFAEIGGMLVSFPYGVARI